MLQAFVEQDYTCSWPNCEQKVVRHRLQLEYKNCHCLKHTLHKLSGRVSDKNWKRDYYREHLKAKCALSGKTWGEAYHEVKEIAARAGYCLSLLIRAQITTWKLEFWCQTKTDTLP